MAARFAFVSALGAGIALTVCGMFSLPVKAQVEVEIRRAQIRAIPIAIAQFSAGNAGGSALASQISDIVEANLERSGLFRPVPRAAHVERTASLQTMPRFADWQAINAQAVAVGEVSDVGGGRVQAAFRLWDVVSGRELAGERYTITANEWRRLGHLVADAVYERLTGERGYFDSRIVFVDETGPKDKRVKRLAIMDQDGANLRLLSDGRDLVLTPRFNATSQQITYTSYRSGQPRVILMDIETGKQERLGDFPNMSFAPRFAPKGDRIVMSLQEGSNSNIFEMEIATRRLIRLTQSNAIDTAPSYAPDGSAIVFESDRDGSQQLYVMRPDGSGQRRISFGQGSYSTPVWSPRGDLIAFTKQIGGKFQIGVIRPDGSGERILTEGFHNEGPTWSPNGRVILFFRDIPGPSGGPKVFSIDLTGYNERQVDTPAFASDPAWSARLR
jgi:TolB protein